LNSPDQPQFAGFAGVKRPVDPLALRFAKNA
jgi:hypothetical protein